MKKLHRKHIVPGFMYSIEIYDQENRKYIIDIRVVVKQIDKKDVQIFSLFHNKIVVASSLAIIEGIERGGIKNLNDEKYSNEAKKEYKKLTKENVLVNVGQSLKKLLNDNTK